MTTQPKITVIGSINMDLVTQSPRFPKVGETLLGDGFNRFMGGKGANQAVAAARLGAEVVMIGAVGGDGFGYALQAGVDVALEGPWSANLDVKKVFVETDASINGGALKSKVKLDPWVVSAGFGYKF